MKKHERVQAAISGAHVDKIPVSAWAHSFNKENQMDSFVKSVINFQEYYDWDFMKIQARYTYHVEDWGYTYTQSGKPEDWPVCTSYPIHNIDDWKKIKVLSPNQGVLKEYLQTVEMIRKKLRGRVPFIMTIFSPLMIAWYLTNEDNKALKRYILEHPEVIHNALEAIAETFANFVLELKSIGVDGIYYATKQATTDFLTPQEYQDLTRVHDLTVLEAAQGFWFNMLHICGDNIHFESMADYPVQVFHWDTNMAGNPGFDQGLDLFPTAVSGGVSRKSMAYGTLDEVKEEIRKAFAQTKGRRFLLGPGCSVLIPPTPEEHLWALRRGYELFEDGPK